MSLINDALKRARDAQRNDPPSGARSLPPVESPARGGIGWILAVAVVLVLAALGVFFGMGFFGHKTPPSVTVKTPVISKPLPAETATMPAPAPAPAPAPPKVVAVPSPATKTNTLSPPAPNTNPPPPAVAAKQWQWPKVQGIIFNAARPLAIVNGQAVNAGDRVGDVQVKQILKDSVIFQQPDGSQKTLAIGE
jgi:hypothetical protein